MGIKLKQALQLSLRTKFIVATSAFAGVSLVALLITGYFNTAIPQKANASVIESISTGSYIINMGVTPQTVGNGLKPYGLIYELNTQYNVPVIWSIEPTKIKDGTDFTHNGVTYKGGTFIIEAEYITPAIAARISYWNSLGVIGNYSVAGMSVPVYTTITTFPRVMIDNLSGNDTIIAKYFLNAGIPPASYEINSPANLSICHDIWINPHGDPTWTTHHYLYNFVTVQKSYIWMQCHAVSMMESCKEAVPPFRQLNYLSTTGLKCYMSGKCGINPEVHAKPLPGAISYFYPTDPVMQFMGSMASVASTGSEKWFVPMSLGGWRTNTKRLSVTGTSPSPLEGVIAVYGHAYGDTTNGQVMYTGGHDMDAGTVAQAVSGQRTFFNFLHLAGKAKAPVLDATINSVINANATDTFSVSVTGGTAPFTYSWNSSVGGTFSAPNDSVTEYTAFHTMLPWQTLITCVVTDACGRRNFVNIPLNVNASALPISLLEFTGKYEDNRSVLLTWKTASETNNNYFTVSRSSNGKSFSPWKVVASKGNSSSYQNYILTDTKPFTGISYYKLTQTDFDGTQVELSCIRVESKSKKLSDITVTAGPNPFTNKITINIPAEYSGESTVKLWSVTGRLVYEQKIVVNGENEKFTLEIPDNIQKGNYLLKIYNSTNASQGIHLIKN